MSVWIWALLLAPVVYFIHKLRTQKRFFEQWGIPVVPEIRIFGVMASLSKKKMNISLDMKQMYDAFPDAKYVGCFTLLTPFIILRDLELIKTIMVKDFDHFFNRRNTMPKKSDPLLGQSLVFIKDERWRKLRNTLTPVFTSSKMKMMCGLMSHCAENFAEQFVTLYKNDKAVNLKDAFTRYASDVIATCAFGIEIDSMKDRTNPFFVHGKRMTDPLGFRRQCKFMILSVFPWIGSILGLTFFDKADEEFIFKLVRDTIKTREENGITRPDMLQLLMEARDKHQLSIAEITAQAFFFFFAGYEAVSSQIVMIAYELAVNPDVQEKLQDEIDEVMRETDNKPTFEAINGMKYLEAIFNESLRRHFHPLISRECTKEYTLPPTVVGAEPFLVKPGMEVIIPAFAIHRDPKHYEDPDRFDPDRFFNKKDAIGDVTNLGFGMGPRMCIANRFAMLETKVLFVQLLSRCSLVPCEKTCIPLVYDVNSFNPLPQGGSWLNVEERQRSV